MRSHITENPSFNDVMSYISIIFLSSHRYMNSYLQYRFNLSDKAPGYGLNDPRSILGGGGGGCEDFSSLLCVRTGSVVHTDSCKMSTVAFPRVKKVKRRASHATSS